MSEHPTFVPVSGITLADAPTEDEPSRHRVVRNCRYTLGPVEGRDMIHNECLNAFHDHCFDEVLKTNPNLLTPGPVPSKCPFCNGLLYPWPALVGALPPAEAAAREAARKRAATEALQREIRADLQAERAFAETDNRRGLGSEAAARIEAILEARERAEAEAQRRDLHAEIQAAIALAETEGRTLEAEARRRDLRAEIQAARALAETEGRTLGQPFFDREESARQQAETDLEIMGTHVAEREARIRAATPLVLARNPGIQRDFVLPDEIEVNPATWDQQDIARWQSIIDRLGTAMAEGDTEVQVIRARLQRSEDNVVYEWWRLEQLEYWFRLEREAQEPNTEMWQEADDALKLLRERANLMHDLDTIRALYWLPWENSDDDKDPDDWEDSDDGEDSDDDEIPDV